MYVLSIRDSDDRWALRADNDTEALRLALEQIRHMNRRRDDLKRIKFFALHHAPGEVLDRRKDTEALDLARYRKVGGFAFLSLISES